MLLNERLKAILLHKKNELTQQCTHCKGMGCQMCGEEYEIYYRLAKAGVPTKYWDFTVEGINNVKLQTLITRYVNNLEENFQEGRGLLLWGGHGTGKTLTSVLILKEALRRFNKYTNLYYTGCFSTFSEIINLKTKGWKDLDAIEDFQKMVRDSNILVIDDVGKEDKTRVINSIFDDILRYRSGNSLPTIITTNDEPETIRMQYGANITSLLKESSLAVNFKGNDYRESTLHDILKKEVFKTNE